MHIRYFSSNSQAFLGQLPYREHVLVLEEELQYVIDTPVDARAVDLVAAAQREAIDRAVVEALERESAASSNAGAHMD